MARPPSAAQLRLIEAADPLTGRLKGTERQLVALVRLGLAFVHPRPPHDCYLSPAGHRLREAPAPEPAPPTGPGGPPGTSAESAAPAAAPGVFAARTGDPPAPADGPARRHEVRTAWQGLLELRRMTNPAGEADRPCGWERAHLIPAAALALEAAGCRPASTAGEGYRVLGTPQPEAVAVHEPDAERLRSCAEALVRAGWQTGEHTEPRRRSRYLLASPRRS
ncbi:hypothetical protein [Streptomyces physcomitrii]|uniref:Uncharacterized protein n=1 Tax=Streptomyces physcomitrii TaxID=2724184 RepID=A0ABX1H6U6_9ACTN|nr:hypothetical protein [Streptomyces physcomitrii]NKI44083.1 hypothetical protein [Streptomyces physcomitrii]